MNELERKKKSKTQEISMVSVTAKEKSMESEMTYEDQNGNSFSWIVCKCSYK